jgi:hypothetical protein
MKYADEATFLNETCCPPKYSNGQADAFVEHGKVLGVAVGHDHKNCFSINYGGVRLTFAVKTGAGCYWTPELNGGTSLTVNKNGTKVEHNFIDVSHLLAE